MKNDLFCGVDRELIQRRLDEKTDKSGNCWVWSGASHSQSGYGVLALRRFNRLAHRLSYALAHGLESLPRDKHVCHRCDNRLCVRPDHLFLASAFENQLDCTIKGRRARGVAYPNAKLNEDAVRFIRLNAGTLAGQIECMRRFGVSQTTITQVYRRKAWVHVKD